MAETNKNDTQQPQVVIAQAVPAQAPGPTEGMLQPVDAETAEKDPNARPTYIVNGVEVDPDGNPVGKSKK